MCQALAYCLHICHVVIFLTVEETTSDVEDGEMADNVQADGSHTLVSSRVSRGHTECTDHETSTDGKPYPFLSITSVVYTCGHLLLFALIVNCRKQ